MPNRMIVKMIEESFNEPFKTGPLIDQQGHYAIFDILMNRQMFEYITDNHLNTKAGQAANADLAVDFPPGQNAGAAFRLLHAQGLLEDFDARRNRGEDLPHEASAGLDAAPGEKRPCLDRTLGLIGFHAVHKTVVARSGSGRPSSM